MPWAASQWTAILLFSLGIWCSPTAVIMEILLSASGGLGWGFQLCPFSTSFSYLRGLKWLLMVGLSFSLCHANFRCNQLCLVRAFSPFPWVLPWLLFQGRCRSWMVLQPFGLFNSVCVGWSPGLLVLPSSQIFLGWQQVHPSHQDQGHKVSRIYLYCCELMLFWPALWPVFWCLLQEKQLGRWTTFSQCSGAFSFHSIAVERIYCKEKCPLIKRTIHRGGWRSRM